MAIHMTEIGKARAKAIERIRKFFLTRPHLRFPTFARKADVHRNTLYGFHAPSWDPTNKTLEKCLAAIDQIEAEEARPKKSRPRGGPMRASDDADKIGKAA